MGKPPDPLRVIDFGSQPPLRSQTLWHALAYGVSAGGPATLSFVRPSSPYVGIGYHRRLEEVDRAACERAGLPIFRRMVGGGPVYLDADQLFFQVIRPAGTVTAPGPRAMRQLLEPAVLAFRDVGIPATIEDSGDIVAGPAKISGTGGGQIAAAAVAVGNVIERFDHDRAAAILAVDDEAVRAEALRLMRNHVQQTPVDTDAFKAALVRRCTEHLGAEPVDGTLSEAESHSLAELDARFCDPAWTEGPARPAPPARQIKVRAGVWVFGAQAGPTRVVGAVVDGRVDRLQVFDPSMNVEAAAIERAAAGLALTDAAVAAGGFGPAGERVAAAIALTNGRGL
jgi:lipoate---protein ligase